MILLDPHPRPIDLIFDAATKKRLEALGNVVWHDGSPATDEYIERHLCETVALIGQSALNKERLDRAPNLKVIFNVESNFLPNIDYLECHRRGIAVLSTAPVFCEACRRDGSWNGAVVSAPHPRGRCKQSEQDKRPYMAKEIITTPFFFPVR